MITFVLPTEVTDKAIGQAVAEAGFTATKIAWQKPSK